MEQATSTLTAPDLLEIHELLAQSFFDLDTGDLEAWVGLFTKDGTLTNPAEQSWIGANELTRFALERSKQPDARQQRQGYNNVIITPTRTGAQSRCYCMQIERLSDGCEVSSMAAITDDWEQEKGKWRIRARRVSHWPSA